MLVGANRDYQLSHPTRPHAVPQNLQFQLHPQTSQRNGPSQPLGNTQALAYTLSQQHQSNVPSEVDDQQSSQPQYEDNRAEDDDEPTLLDKMSLVEKLIQETTELKNLMLSEKIVSLCRSLNFYDATIATDIGGFSMELQLQRENLTILFAKDDISGKNMKTLVLQNIENCSSAIIALCIFLTEKSNHRGLSYYLMKGKLVKQLTALTQAVRSKLNQLMTTITMGILQDSKKRIDLPPPQSPTLMDAYRCYYGINRPINYKEAIQKLIYLCEHEENSDAMVLLAECYQTGNGLSQPDGQLAQQWLERAAKELKHYIAMTRLGVIYIQQSIALPAEDGQKVLLHKHGKDLLVEAAINECVEAEIYLGIDAYDSQDFIQAREWFLKAAEHGSTVAVNYLGLLYYHGDGVIRQTEVAFQYFLQAVQSGNTEACFNAATCLELGEGVEKNILEAMMYYNIGAIRGCSSCMFSLGYLLVKRAIHMHATLSSVNQDHPSNYDVSKMTAEFKRRYHGAMEYLHSNGILRYQPVGQVSYSCCSQDVSIVISKGLHWLRKAVEAGVIDAAYTLGQVYEQGLAGSAIDLFSAYSQYVHAAIHGNHSLAALYAGHMLYTGQGVQLNYQAAATFYDLSAKQGNVEAMNALAILLEDGRAQIESADHHTSSQLAASWYLEACRQGHGEESAINLAALLEYHIDIVTVVTVSGERILRCDVLNYLHERFPVTLYVDTVDEATSELRNETVVFPSQLRSRNYQEFELDQSQSFVPAANVDDSVQLTIARSLVNLELPKAAKSPRFNPSTTLLASSSSPSFHSTARNKIVNPASSRYIHYTHGSATAATPTVKNSPYYYPSHPKSRLYNTSVSSLRESLFNSVS